MDSVPLFMGGTWPVKDLNSLVVFPSLTVEHCAVSKSEFVEIALQHEGGYIKSVLSSRVS